MRRTRQITRAVASDYHGEPLSAGCRVNGWLDGVKYTATLKEVRPHHPGDGNFRRITLIRDDDHAEIQSFSDAVTIVKSDA